VLGSSSLEQGSRKQKTLACWIDKFIKTIYLQYLLPRFVGSLTLFAGAREHFRLAYVRAQRVSLGTDASVTQTGRLMD